MSLSQEQRNHLDSLGNAMEISCANYERLYDDYNDRRDPFATVEAYESAYAVLKDQKKDFIQLCASWGLNYRAELEKFTVPW